jgi:hypothetical protein
MHGKTTIKIVISTVYSWIKIRTGTIQQYVSSVWIYIAMKLSHFLSERKKLE